MKIEYRVETWRDGTAFTFREEVPPGLERPEGWVVLQDFGQPDIEIRDALWALLLNLGYTAVVRCVGDAHPEHTWPLTTEAKTVTLATRGDQVELTAGGRTAQYPGASFWPSAFAAAARFTAALERSGADDPTARFLREREGPARALVASRGWELPPAPTEPAPEPAEPAAARWGELSLYTRRPDEARAFYRAVLGPVFDRVPLLAADGPAGPPQWVAELVGLALDEKAGFLQDEGGVELERDGERAVWMDPWGAVLAAGVEGRPGGVRVVRRELRTAAPQRAAEFYGRWLGWEVFPDPVGWRLGSDRAVVRLAEPGEHAHWVQVIEVPDLDAASARAEALGGVVVARELGAIRILDPQGALLALGAPSS